MKIKLSRFGVWLFFGFCVFVVAVNPAGFGWFVAPIAGALFTIANLMEDAANKIVEQLRQPPE